MSEEAYFSGVHPDDLALLDDPRMLAPLPDIAPCVAIWHGEVLGPFRTHREASSALDDKLEELASQGVDLHGMDAGAVIFVDAADYHTAQFKRTGDFNG